MNQSTELNALASSLCKAQASLGGAVKGSINPHFKSRFADLAEVIETAKPHLAANGLSFTQAGVHREGVQLLRTTLLHSSGQWLAGEYALTPTKPDAQGYGAAMTYARRYCLAALLGIPQVDDDGETASGRGAPPATEAPTRDLTSELEAQFGGIKEWFMAYCRAKNYLKEGQGLADLEPMIAVRAIRDADKLKEQFAKENIAK